MFLETSWPKLSIVRDFQKKQKMGKFSKIKISTHEVKKITNPNVIPLLKIANIEFLRSRHRVPGSPQKWSHPCARCRQKKNTNAGVCIFFFPTEFEISMATPNNPREVLAEHLLSEPLTQKGKIKNKNYLCPSLTE